MTVDAGDGLILHVEVDRASSPIPAPAVLLLHGFTGTGDTWRRLSAALTDVADVIRVDLPGHGRSSAPADPGRFAFDRLAHDVAHVLDVVGRRRAFILGYSMGGRAALKFALAHPTRVDGLILESTSPGIADAAQRAARRASDRALADRIERDGVAAFVDYWERLPLWASQSSLDEWRRGELRAQRLAQSAAGLAGALRGAGQGEDPPVADRLHEIAAAVLLVAGALDGAYVAHARDMAARMPHARLEIVPDAGHAVHLERPAEYATAVKSFLASNSFRMRPATSGD